MSKEKQAEKLDKPVEKVKDVYVVHLESGTVSVEATSLTEALKLVKAIDNENKESSNG